MHNPQPSSGSKPENPLSENEAKEKMNKLFELINKARQQTINDQSSSSTNDDEDEDNDGLKEYRGVIL